MNLSTNRSAERSTFTKDSLKRTVGLAPLAALVVGYVLFPLACGNSTNNSQDAGSDGGPADAGDSGYTGDSGFDAGPSACGHPGDVGVNDSGVGQYCLSILDCPPTAQICSDIDNNPATPQFDTFFCVNPNCDECSPPGTCGPNATCACQSVGNCGCIPDSCTVLLDAGNPPCMKDGGSDGG